MEDLSPKRHEKTKQKSLRQTQADSLRVLALHQGQEPSSTGRNDRDPPGPLRRVPAPGTPGGRSTDPVNPVRSAVGPVAMVDGDREEELRGLSSPPMVNFCGGCRPCAAFGGRNGAAEYPVVRSQAASMASRRGPESREDAGSGTLCTQGLYPLSRQAPFVRPNKLC